jgi:DNA-binding transcriptional regulator YdaS (Cro superfamily)
MISAPKDIFSSEFFALMVHETTMERTSKLLGVHPTTLRRWVRGVSPVPKIAAMALFWETRWGRSVIDCDHLAELNLMRQRVRILERQVVKAKDIITGLRAMQYGTANEPLFDDLRDFDGVTADTQQRAQIG